MCYTQVNYEDPYHKYKMSSWVKLGGELFTNIWGIMLSAYDSYSFDRKGMNLIDMLPKINNNNFFLL